MFQNFKQLLNKGLQKLDEIESSSRSEKSPNSKPVPPPSDDKPKETPALEVPKRIITTLKEETLQTTNRLASISIGNNQSLSPEVYKANIDFAAGIDLVKMYEKSILLLHDNNVKVIQQAELADKKIGPVVQYIERQSDTFNRFVREVNNTMPEIENNITKMRNEIDFICSRLEMFENVLTQQFEDLGQEQLLYFKQAENYATIRYREKKTQELNLIEQGLKVDTVKRGQMELEIEKLKIQQKMQEQKLLAQAQERADRIREHELLLEREKEQARLRQELNTAFQRDLESFKKKIEDGSVTPPPTVVAPTSPVAIPAVNNPNNNSPLVSPTQRQRTGSKLEEVVIEQDLNDPSLQDFLNDVSLDEGTSGTDEVSKDVTDDSNEQEDTTKVDDDDKDAFMEVVEAEPKETKVTVDESEPTKKEEAISSSETPAASADTSNQEKVEDIDEEWFS